MSSIVFPTFAGQATERSQSSDWGVQRDKVLNGRSLRSTWETYPVDIFTLTINFLRSASPFLELQSLQGHFDRHGGTFDSFLFTDPEDNSVTLHNFAVADGSTTQFQLQRTRVPSAALPPASTRAYWPSIGDGYKPITELNGAPRIYLDDLHGGGPTLLVPGVDYTVSALGLVTCLFTPDDGDLLSSTCSFYKRVTFGGPIQYSRFLNQVWSAEFTLVEEKSEEMGSTMSPVRVPVLYRDNFTTGTGPFTLAHTPIPGNAILVSYNGLEMVAGVDFTQSGAVVTPIGSNIPASGESYAIAYLA